MARHVFNNGSCFLHFVKQYRCIQLRIAFKCLTTVSNSDTSYSDENVKKKGNVRGNLKMFSAQERIPKKYKKEINHVIKQYRDQIEHFASILRCKPSVMSELVEKDTRFVTCVDFEALTTKLRLLHSYGYDVHTIIGCFHALNVTMPKLQRRLREIEEVRKVDPSLSLAYKPEEEYNRMIKQLRRERECLGDHTSHVSYVAALLECTEEELMLSVEKTNYEVLSRGIIDVTDLVKLYLSHGFTHSLILQNLFVLKACVSVARERLERLGKLDLILQKHFVYIVTGSNKMFERSVVMWMRDKEALGVHSDKREFLKHRLHLTDAEYDTLIKKVQMLPSLRAHRLKSALDVLMNMMSLTSKDVLKHPRLLYYKTERLVYRWNVLSKAMVQDKPKIISELSLSKADFDSKYL